MAWGDCWVKLRTTSALKDWNLKNKGQKETARKLKGVWVWEFVVWLKLNLLEAPWIKILFVFRLSLDANTRLNWLLCKMPEWWYVGMAWRWLQRPEFHLVLVFVSNETFIFPKSKFHRGKMQRNNFLCSFQLWDPITSYLILPCVSYQHSFVGWSGWSGDLLKVPEAYFPWKEIEALEAQQPTSLWFKIFYPLGFWTK